MKCNLGSGAGKAGCGAQQGTVHHHSWNLQSALYKHLQIFESDAE